MRGTNEGERVVRRLKLVVVVVVAAKGCGRGDERWIKGDGRRS
jgi:hypothetical protein